MAIPPRIVACPRCSKPVEWSASSRFRPFCSERCKFMDLGAWATESYRVPAVDNDPEDDAETTASGDR